MLTKQDYQAAVDVLDAVNLSGVVFSFAEIMQRICDEANAQGYGAEWKNRHPIVQLFVDALADKSGMGGTMCTGAFLEAYDFCTHAGAGKYAHLTTTTRGNGVVEYEVKGNV